MQLHPLAIENAIRELQVNSQLLQEKLNGEDCVYLNYYFYAEMSVAKRLLELSADYDAPNMEYGCNGDCKGGKGNGRGAGGRSSVRRWQRH